MSAVENQLPNHTPTETGFVPIPVEIVPAGQKLEFDLYNRVADTFVLYATAGSCFEPERAQIMRGNGIGTLYARSADPHRLQYFESNLGRILREERIPLKEKSQIFYDVATNLVQEILANPRSGQAIKRSKETVQSLVELTLAKKDAFFHLVRITSHDYYTYTHSVNVCTLAISLAQRLGIASPVDCTIIGLGALLHDVGKCMIGHQILNKPASLTEEEWTVMRKHPEWGAKLLAGTMDMPANIIPMIESRKDEEQALEASEVPEDAVRIIEQHHESCDGKGYPCGLTAQEIHLFAKMVKIADIYDALTTNRCYRQAITPFEALKLMRKLFAHAVDQKIFREFVLLLGFGTGA